MTDAIALLAQRGPVFWRGSFPVLTASCAPGLLDNYRVVRQTPRAGVTIHPFLPNADGTLKISYVDLMVKAKAVSCST